MGMSGDFEIAIEEGATVVRVGQAIFGAHAMPDAYYWPTADACPHPNKNSVPNDPRSPFVTSGLRLLRCAVVFRSITASGPALALAASRPRRVDQAVLFCTMVVPTHSVPPLHVQRRISIDRRQGKEC